MKFPKSRTTLAGAVMITSATMAATVAGTATVGGGDEARGAGSSVGGQLNPLNNSGVTGSTEVHVRHRRVHVDVEARGLAKNLPHAQHVHFGAQARHECPTVADDADGDFRLTTLEGAPAYGPVRISLTTDGSTGPDSVLAVDRYPTAPGGSVDYERSTRTSKAVARAIRRGEGVVVIHGVDYNNNGEYDFDSAGQSDLDPNLPAEATDPAACGVLRK